jgi:hypothetical protein
MVLNLIQTIAIVVMLWITVVQLKSTLRADRATAALEITTSHREIWSHLLTNPALGRILDPNVDLQKEPVTVIEEFFVVLVANHMSAVYDAHKEGIHRLYPDDMRAFFILPIPRAVWARILPYQALEFSEFMNGLLAGAPRSGEVKA